MKPRLVFLVGLLALVGAGATLFLTKGCRRDLNATITEGELYAGPKKLEPAEDWPRWRGPRGDGISRETVAVTWGEGGAPTRLWRANVGIGYASPVAKDGRLYLFSMAEQREVLTCFDANTGKILWSDSAETGWTGDYPGTRATPAIEGDAIYTYGAAGHLICRDLASGKPRWKVEVMAAAGAKALQWGTASSPLVELGHVYVQTGTGGPVAVAVDAKSGKVNWRSERTGTAGYAAPILADVKGAKQLIVFAGDALVGMDPLTGRTLWTYDWPTSYNVNASTPIYHEGKLFITSAYDRGGALFQVSPTGVTKLWENKEVKSRFQQVILDNGHLYANSERRLKCVTWEDGKRKWAKDGAEFEMEEHGPIVRVAGDMLILQGDRGRVTVARATAGELTPLGSFQATTGDAEQIWATPLVYGKRLYVKGSKELVCYDLGGQ